MSISGLGRVLALFALFALTSCQSARDEDVKFFKVTPGMSKERVLAILGEPEKKSEEPGGIQPLEVWRYPHHGTLKRGQVVGIIPRFGGPTARQKATYEDEMRAQRYNAGPREIVFKNGSVFAIRRLPPEE